MTENPLTDLLEFTLNIDVPNDSIKYTKELRAAATAAGWPAIVVTQLTVIPKDGHWDVIPPDGIKAEYAMLEEGIPYGQPNAVVRPFLESLKNRKAE